MADTPKGSYKGFTEAHKRGNERYRKTIDTIRVYVPKGKRDVIKTHAAGQGESMNHFIVRAIDEAIQRDSEDNQTI